MPAPKAPEAFFHAIMKVYKGISLEVAFFTFFAFFALHFLRSCIFSPPPPGMFIFGRPKLSPRGRGWGAVILGVIWMVDSSENILVFLLANML